MISLLVPVPVVENVVWHLHLLSNLFVRYILSKMEVVVLFIKKSKAGKGKDGKGKDGKAGNKVNQGDNKKVHYLEPLAFHILNDIITSLVNTTSPSTSSNITPENTCENNNNRTNNTI